MDTTLIELINLKKYFPTGSGILHAVDDVKQAVSDITAIPGMLCLRHIIPIKHIFFRPGASKTGHGRDTRFPAFTTICPCCLMMTAESIWYTAAGQSV